MGAFLINLFNYFSISFLPSFFLLKFDIIYCMKKFMQYKSVQSLWGNFTSTYPTPETNGWVECHSLYAKRKCYDAFSTTITEYHNALMPNWIWQATDFVHQMAQLHTMNSASAECQQLPSTVLCLVTR